MVQRDDIISFLNDYFKIKEFEDSLPNGLQVEGKAGIKKIITSVSASLELFDQAVTKHADMVIVHHGMFFNKDSPVVKGGLRKRLRVLLENDINLAAYHLPLDAHQEIGHSVLGAKALGVKNIIPFEVYGVSGELAAQPANAFFQTIESVYGAKALVFPFGPALLNRVAIVSGGAARELSRAIAAGMDLFITGEASESVMHLAKENDIHFVAAGHYATERPGIVALTRLLEDNFAVVAEFVDLPNPV